MKNMSIWGFLAVLMAGAFLLEACSKTQANPRSDVIRNVPLQSPDNRDIGSITVTEGPEGEARVTVQVHQDVLATGTAPFTPVLRDLREVVAYLNPLDHEGVSITSPVVSAQNNNITVSYDALLRTKDLTVEIHDADNRVVASAELR